VEDLTQGVNWNERGAPKPANAYPRDPRDVLDLEPVTSVMLGAPDRDGRAVIERGRGHPVSRVQPCANGFRTFGLG